MKLTALLNHFSIEEGKKRRSRRMDVLMQSEFGVVVKQIASLYTNGVCALIDSPYQTVLGEVCCTPVYYSGGPRGKGGWAPLLWREPMYVWSKQTMLDC
jgi:hypothetical protein